MSLALKFIEMYSLIIETSTKRGIVAIMDDGKARYFAGLPFGYSNSRFLLPKIDEGLECVGIKAQQLDRIVVGIGPGSYTGIRVGAAAAKSISYASQVSLIGICTLKCFIPVKDGPFAAIIDAKMGGAYFMKGVRSQDKILYTSEPYVCSLEHLEPHLKNIQVLVTPESSRLQPILSQWEWQETGPDPAHMNFLANEKYEKGEYSVDGTLKLLYLT